MPVIWYRSHTCPRTAGQNRFWSLLKDKGNVASTKLSTVRRWQVESDNQLNCRQSVACIRLGPVEPEQNIWGGLDLIDWTEPPVSPTPISVPMQHVPSKNIRTLAPPEPYRCSQVRDRQRLEQLLVLGDQSWTSALHQHKRRLSTGSNVVPLRRRADPAGRSYSVCDVLIG